MLSLITYKYQKISQRTKQILWKEHINPVDLLEKEDMDLDQEWPQGVVEKLLLDVDPRGEKYYLLKYK